MNPNAKSSHLGVLVLCCLVLGSLLLFFPGGAQAQLATAALNGTVKDSSGAMIPGATIELTNVQTNVRQTALTNSAGIYVMLQVPPGTYRLRISKRGFETKTQGPFTLSVNQTTSFNFSLIVGSSTQTVTVEAAGANLQTSSAELGTVVATRQVNDLPLNGRNFTQMLALTPGVSTVNSSQSSGVPQWTGNPIGNYSFPSVNGQTNRSNFFLVDGLNDQESLLSTYSVAPIVDDIEEFKVDSHNDQAQFGGVLGGVVNVVTKSGTNEFHGAAWEFLRNNALDARNPFFSSTSQLQQNQFGANIGGPVVLPHYNGHNRTFFFGSYEGARIHTGTTAQAFIPTSQEIANGDFSDFAGQVYNPYSTNPTTHNRAPFMCDSNGNPLAPFADGTQPSGMPCNKIPSSLIDPHMQAWAKALWPVPNVTTNPTFNYQTNLLNTHNSDTYSFRVDEQLGQKDSFWFRFSHFNSPENDQAALGNNGKILYRAHVWGVNWNHTFGSSSILTVAMGRNFANDIQGSLFPATRSQQLVQASGLSQFFTCGFIGPRSCLASSPGISGITSGGETTTTTSPADIWEWKADFSKILNKHTLSMGADFNTDGFMEDVGYGNLSFSSSPTSNPTAAAGEQGGYSVASFLLGVPDGATYRNVHETEHGGWVDGFYFQDQWKATGRLTINLGARYDVSLFPIAGSAKEKNNQIGDLDLHNGSYILEASAPSCASAGKAPCIPGGTLPPNVLITPNSNGSIIHNTYDNIQPRLGLAFRLANKTVVRASFGRFFDNWAGETQMAQNFFGTWPSVSQQLLSNLNTTTPTTLAEDVFSGGARGALPAPTPFEQDTWFVDPLIQNPYSYQWNFGVQQSLGQNTTLTVNYVGSDGHRLDSGAYANTATAPGPGAVPSASCYTTTCAPAIVAAENRFPFPYQVVTLYDTSYGKSWYNALQFSLDKRASKGLSYLVSYTWSKAEDVGEDGWFNAEGASIQNPYNRMADKSVAGYDLTNIFTASSVYQLPFGKGMRFESSNRVLNDIIGGWQLNGILTLTSGAPYTITANASIPNTGNGAERANLVGNPSLPNPTIREWFNTAAFVPPPAFTFGTLGRNTLRGDGRQNLDISLFRSFLITESKRLEFRAEAFNSTNTPIWGNPGSNVSGNPALFGKVTATANSPRILQFALKFYF